MAIQVGQVQKCGGEWQVNSSLVQEIRENHRPAARHRQILAYLALQLTYYHDPGGPHEWTLMSVLYISVVDFFNLNTQLSMLNEEAHDTNIRLYNTIDFINYITVYYSYIHCNYLR